MTMLIIGPDEERCIAALIDLARANPLTREYLTRMSRGFDPADPSTRGAAGEMVPLHFTIDLPIGVRVTYTEEDQPVGRCRHLSVSVERAGALPAPVLIDELLVQFGFAGRVRMPGADLMIWPEHYASGRVAVNVLERVGAPAVKAKAL